MSATIRATDPLTPAQKSAMTRACRRLARLLKHAEDFHAKKWAQLIEAAGSLGHPIVQTVMANWDALPEKERERYLKDAEWWRASKEQKRRQSNSVGLFGPIRNCFREEPTMGDLLTRDRPIPTNLSGKLTAAEKKRLLAIKAKAIGSEYAE